MLSLKLNELSGVRLVKLAIAGRSELRLCELLNRIREKPKMIRNCRVLGQRPLIIVAMCAASVQPRDVASCESSLHYHRSGEIAREPAHCHYQLEEQPSPHGELWAFDRDSRRS
jgi:hypothetical protein